MVISNLYVRCSSFRPSKADPVLVVDTDAVFNRPNTPLCRQASARPETAKRNKQPHKWQTLKARQAFQQGLRIYEQLEIAQEVAFAQALLASVVDG
jgi:hypothetical protein